MKKRIIRFAEPPKLRPNEKAVLDVLLNGGVLQVVQGTYGTSTGRGTTLSAKQHFRLFDIQNQTMANVRQSVVERLFARGSLEVHESYWTWGGLFSGTQKFEFRAGDINVLPDTRGHAKSSQAGGSE